MAQQNGEQLFTPAPSYIFEEHTDSAFFVWWYHLTSPTTPDVQASHKVWTRFRHARSTSRMLLALLLLTLLSLPVDFLLPNFVVGTLVITVFPMLLIATSLNRLGQTTLAGVFLMALLEGVLLGNLFLSYEDGSGTYLTPFYWLILPLLVVSLLLPLRWVFAVAVLNSLFIMFVLLLTLHVSVLLVFQPLLLQGCVALVAFL